MQYRCHQARFLGEKYTKNGYAVGAPLQTPLWVLTAFPRPPCSARKGNNNNNNNNLLLLEGITQFYLPPHMNLSLSALPSHRASPPFGWYSLLLPAKGWPGWVDMVGWLHTGLTVTHRELNPDTVAHLSTNRAWRWLTSLIEANALTTTPDHHWRIEREWGGKKGEKMEGEGAETPNQLCPVIFESWPGYSSCSH